MSRRLRDEMNVVGDRLRSVRAYLDRAGYQFRTPKEVLPGPSPNVESEIEQLEGMVGRVPEVLAEFWRTVGSVDFMGSHPKWLGGGYPDPLVVYPPAAAIDEAKEYVALDHPDDYVAESFRAPIAPDPLHKENISGGMWYGIAIPNPSDDPIVLEERHELPFTQYLELALSWGGFLGLEAAKRHSWPLEELREAARRPTTGCS